MAEPFANAYNLRRVADSSSKACAFCFKPTATVLITADGTSDFFYTCDIHLKDSNFAIPIYDEEYLKTQKEKKELDLQMKQLKLKWDEKNRYASWDRIVSYTKSFGKSSDPSKDDKEKPKSDKSIEDELKDINTKSADFDKILNRQPKKYQLNQQIYNLRIAKKRQKATARQDTTNIKDLSAFPSVPKNLPSAS
jgi:hypothetical protein